MQLIYIKARWTDVIGAWENQSRVSGYLMKIIWSYLGNVFFYGADDGTAKRVITSWCDEILFIDMPEDIYLALYADYIATGITTRDAGDAQSKLNKADFDG